MDSDPKKNISLFAYFQAINQKPNQTVAIFPHQNNQIECGNTMEHSYSKDVLPKDNVEVMATRTILIPRPPQCPSCHHTSLNDDVVTVFIYVYFG